LLALAKKEWALALVGLEMKQIKQGIDRTRNSGDTFPPSLPKFLSYCRNDDNWAHRGAAYREFNNRALPKPPVNKELGRAALKQIRGML